MSAFNMQCIKGTLLAATGVAGDVAIEMPKAKGSLLPAIVGIDVLHPQMNELSNKTSKWFLNSKSNGTTLPDEDDEEVVNSGQRDSLETHTDVGQGVEERWERITFPAPIPISKNTLYFQGYQDSGGNHTYKFRIWWVPRLVKGAVQQQSMDVNVQY